MGLASTETVVEEDREAFVGHVIDEIIFLGFEGRIPVSGRCQLVQHDRPAGLSHEPAIIEETMRGQQDRFLVLLARYLGITESRRDLICCGGLLGTAKYTACRVWIFTRSMCNEVDGVVVVFEDCAVVDEVF